MDNISRLEILRALKLFMDNKIEIVNLIFECKNSEECIEQLKSKYSLFDYQAQVIIDCQIKRLCELDRLRLDREIEELNNNLI